MDFTGMNVFIRTVTYFYTGHVVEMDDNFIKLDNAAWIADTGRFSDAMNTGELSEVEPYPVPCLVSRGAIVDLCEWKHPLPTKVK